MDRVLVIDETENPVDVVDGLRELGFQVDAENSVEAGVLKVQEGLHHIIILDDGFSQVGTARLVADLREITQGPIVVMGWGGDTAMVEAVIGGADLYVERQIPPRELAARLRALVRRCQNCAEAEDNLGCGATNDQLGQLFEKLSQTEAKLLRFLLERDGRLTAREELMAGVWGDRAKETSLRFYIWQLRRKLSSNGNIQIMNQKGMGYVLKVHPTG
jgi:DNA-binding response OmpR family regulator